MHPMAPAAGGRGAERENEGPEHLRLQDRIPFILWETGRGLLFAALVPVSKDRLVACP